jgi:hypothetical protein
MKECKIQCIKIIQLILDYDCDLTIRQICKHFQRFQVRPKNKGKLNESVSNLK